MNNYIDAKALESGEVLLYLKRSFLEKRSTETLIPVLSCLRDEEGRGRSHCSYRP